MRGGGVCVCVVVTFSRNAYAQKDSISFCPRLKKRVCARHITEAWTASFRKSRQMFICTSKTHVSSDKKKMETIIGRAGSFTRRMYSVGLNTLQGHALPLPANVKRIGTMHDCMTSRDFIVKVAAIDMGERECVS